MTRSLRFAILAALLLSGCELFWPHGGGDPTDVERNRAVWADNSNGTYSFELLRGCFCGYAGRFRVEVDDFQVTNVQDLLSQRPRPIPVEHFDTFHTIEAMFDLIEDARTQDAAVVDVDFSDLGHPTTIRLDYSLQIADDELHLEVSNVSVGD